MDMPKFHYNAKSSRKKNAQKGFTLTTSFQDDNMQYTTKKT